MQPIRVGRGLTPLRHSMRLSIILTDRRGNWDISHQGYCSLNLRPALCMRSCLPGLMEVASRNREAEIDSSKSANQARGCLQGPVKAASVTWMVWTSFSCYDVKVGFHSWLHAKLWPGDRAVWHSGMLLLLLLSGFSRVRLCVTP